MKIWIESLSMKNFIIMVLSVLLLFQFFLTVYMTNGVIAKIDKQQIEMIPPELAGTTVIPLESKRARVLTMMSGYLVSHAENYSQGTIDSFYVPMLMNAAPESYTNLKKYFGDIAAFVSSRHIISATQIDPATERFNMKTKEYSSIGITELRSSQTGKVIATEMREYKLKWKLESGYSAVLSYSYVILDSSIPERKLAGEKQKEKMTPSEVPGQAK